MIKRFVSYLSIILFTIIVSGLSWGNEVSDDMNSYSLESNTEAGSVDWEKCSGNCGIPGSSSFSVVDRYYSTIVGRPGESSYKGSGEVAH